MQGRRSQATSARLEPALIGTFTNAKMGEKYGEGTTDLVIEAVVKKHDILRDRKTLTLARYVPVDDKKSKYLVLCDVYQGRINLYRVVMVRSDCDLAGYLAGALKVKDGKPGDRPGLLFQIPR